MELSGSGVKWQWSQVAAELGGSGVKWQWSQVAAESSGRRATWRVELSSSAVLSRHLPPGAHTDVARGRCTDRLDVGNGAADGRRLCRSTRRCRAEVPFDTKLRRNPFCISHRVPSVSSFQGCNLSPVLQVICALSLAPWKRRLLFYGPAQRYA